MQHSHSINDPIGGLTNHPGLSRTKGSSWDAGLFVLRVYEPVNSPMGGTAGETRSVGCYVLVDMLQS